MSETDATVRRWVWRGLPWGSWPPCRSRSSRSPGPSVASSRRRWPPSDRRSIPSARRSVPSARSYAPRSKRKVPRQTHSVWSFGRRSPGSRHVSRIILRATGTPADRGSAGTPQAGPRSLDTGVATRAAEEVVVPAAAEKQVRAALAEQAVGAAEPGDVVGALQAGDLVRASLAGERVPPARADDRLEPGERVVALAARPAGGEVGRHAAREVEAEGVEP